MSDSAKEFFGQFAQDMEKMQELTPNSVNGFMGMFKKIMGEGALTVREKELVALGIGLSKECVPCIRMHVKKALDAGAKKEEILEAAEVAVMMNGGPSYTHLPYVIEALEACGA
jgi:AhpD family alkylhydroperoxidase